MTKYYNLTSLEEFRVRYYISRIGFEDLWNSKNRGTRESIESFYNEHDKDLWRQAFLSKYNPFYKKKILSAYHIANKVRAIKVLDYGCGAGVLARFLAIKGFEVDAADIPSKTLSFVKSTMDKLLKRIITVDSNFELPDAHYDLIITLDALEHTVNPLEIIKKLLAALKKGGFLYIHFPTEVDFTSTHTQEAQIQRPLVFSFLNEQCETLATEAVYRKN